jgi:hypothetical protein
MSLIKIASRTGYSDRVLSIAGTDYDFVEVSLSGSRGLHYEPRHSHVVTVTVNRRFEAPQVRVFTDFEVNADAIQALVVEACEAVGVNPNDLR